MLTGGRAFAGDDIADTLAAVLRAEPDFDALPADTPQTLRRLLRLSLTQDVKGRIRDIADVRFVLEGAFETPPTDAPVRGTRSTVRPWLLASLAVVAGLLAGFELRSLLSVAATSRPVRLTLLTPPGSRSRERAVSISADGTLVAFAAQHQIWLRDLADLEAEPVDGTDGGTNPFFSPDGEWLSFFADGRLQKVPVSGGAPVALQTYTGAPQGASWQEDGRILFAKGNVVRIPVGGGEPVEPEALYPVNDDGFAVDPQILPGGVAIVYTNIRVGSQFQILARNLAGGEPRVLVDGARAPRYLPTGHLVYFQSGTLFAAPFDPRSLTLKGSSVPLVNEVRPTLFSAHFDVSELGTLVYLRGADHRRLVWVDRDGREEPLPLEPAANHLLDLSPDGSKLAFHAHDDIWLYEFSTGTLSRFTFDPASDSHGLWSADGERIFFSSDRDGPRNVYWKPSDGSGEVERLTEGGSAQWPKAVTPDGGVLFIEMLAESTLDILRLDLSASSEPEPFVRTDADERLPSVSPDGRFVAYESSRSGATEIYVRTFPEGDGPWQISNEGGRAPRWSPDGRELFYLDEGAMIGVSIETEPAVRTVGTRKLFEGNYYDLSHSYDVSRDGTRFIMIQQDAGYYSDVGSDLVVVLDWFEELKRLVPID